MNTQHKLDRSRSHNRLLPFWLLVSSFFLSAGQTRAEMGVQAWVQRYGHFSDSNDGAQKAVTDNAGNVIVAGYTDEGVTGQDMLVIKYSGAGTALWTNRYNGPGNRDDYANAAAVDSSGNVIVTGYSYGNFGSSDYATIAYSAAGVSLWTNRYDGPANGDDQANDVAVDGNGKVFVTGRSVGSSGVYDYATIAYSSTGVALWTNRYNGPGNGHDFATSAAVDDNGNVFVTGHSYGSGSSEDYATIAYSSAGVSLWTNPTFARLASFEIFSGASDSVTRPVFVKTPVGRPTPLPETPRPVVNSRHVSQTAHPHQRRQDPHLLFGL